MLRLSSAASVGGGGGFTAGVGRRTLFRGRCLITHKQHQTADVCRRCDAGVPPSAPPTPPIPPRDVLPRKPQGSRNVPNQLSAGIRPPDSGQRDETDSTRSRLCPDSILFLVNVVWVKCVIYSLIYKSCTHTRMYHKNDLTSYIYLYIILQWKTEGYAIRQRLVNS